MLYSAKFSWVVPVLSSEAKCVAQGYNSVPIVRLKQGPLILESSTPPLKHWAPQLMYMLTINKILFLRNHFKPTFGVNKMYLFI